MTSFKDFRVKLLRTIAPATKALTSCFYTYSTAAAWWRCTVCAGDYGASKTMNKNDSWWLVALFMRYGVSVRACVHVFVCVCACVLWKVWSTEMLLCVFSSDTDMKQRWAKKKNVLILCLSLSSGFTFSVIRPYNEVFPLSLFCCQCERHISDPSFFLFTSFFFPFQRYVCRKKRIHNVYHRQA